MMMMITMMITMMMMMRSLPSPPCRRGQSASTEQEEILLKHKWKTTEKGAPASFNCQQRSTEEGERHSEVGMLLPLRS